jgi:hypothetical protein
MVCVTNTYLVGRFIILDQHLEVSTKNEKDKNNELGALSHRVLRGQVLIVAVPPCLVELTNHECNQTPLS